MSLDASWSARQPGLLPAALIRAAIAHAKAAGHAATLLTPPDAIEEWGSSIDVLVDGAGEVTLYQPDGDDESFSLGISSSSGGRERWDELFEAADMIATKLGLVFDDADSIDEMRALSDERSQLVDVTSLRVEIGLRSRPATEHKRSVVLEGTLLGRVRRDGLEELDAAILRAVAFALSGSEGARRGKVTVANVAAWLDDVEGIVGESDGIVRVDREDATSISVMVDDDTVVIMAWPAIHLTMQEGLVLNDSSFAGAAALALGEDDDEPEGVWLFQTKLRNDGLDKKTFLAIVEAFADDLDELVREHPLPDDDESDDASRDE